MQTGGKLVAEGAEGCGFDRAPTCASGPTPTTIDGKPVFAKITTEDAELVVGRKIMALPLAANYFSLPTQSCVPRIPLDDEDADSCELIKGLQDDEGRMTMNLVSLFMPNGGVSIMPWVVKDRQRAGYTFIRVFKHLLEGMKIYQDAGYIHNDIHTGNIVVDAHNVARYIDFGLVYKPADVTTMQSANINTEFKPSKVWHAPEIQVWRMLNSNKKPLSVKEIIQEGILRFAEEGNNEYVDLQKIPGHDTISGLVTFGENTQAERKANNFGVIVRKYGKKMDIWRLGLVMWAVWRVLIKQKMLGDLHPIFRQEAGIYHVINGLTSFDVEKRWDPETALKHFG
jgi:serine/threonine protein kinase